MSDSVSGWTVDTLREAVNQRFADQDRLLTERFAMQQKAMSLAFDSADKAVQAALQAAKEATHKAELASDKRFDAVNEFREQQADIITRFLMRTEYNVSHQALADKVSDNNDRLTAQIAALELRLSSRLDLDQGENQGSYRSGVISEAKVNQKLVIAGIALSIAIIIAQVVISLISHHA